MIDTAHLILGGAFIGGLVSGLTGFGTGLFTLPIWLQAMLFLAGFAMIATAR